MRRPARLESARAWLASDVPVTVGLYARRYGVDRYTASEELTRLGAALPASAARWAVRRPSVPKARKQRVPDPPRADVPLGDAPGWVEWGGVRVFAVGFTAGGAPYGLRANAVDEHDAWLPDDDSTILRDGPNGEGPVHASRRVEGRGARRRT